MNHVFQLSYASELMAYSSRTGLCYASNLVRLLCSHMMNQHCHDRIVFHSVYLDTFALVACCINLINDSSGAHFVFCNRLRTLAVFMDFYFMCRHGEIIHWGIQAFVRLQTQLMTCILYRVYDHKYNYTQLYFCLYCVFVSTAGQ